VTPSDQASWPSGRKVFEILCLLGAQLAGAFLVTFTLPYSLQTFGEPYHGDGQQEFGLIILLTLAGMQVAAVYLVVSTIAYGIVRKKSMRTKFLVLAGVLVPFVLALAYSGITGHYQ
jgi:hypothetical protein